MRKDVYVSNDSGGLSVLSSSILEKVIDDGRENDRAFVDAHQAILGSLVGDDSFIARVVVGEPLTPDEQEQWIAHYRWALDVPCGKLLVCGGFDPDVLGDWLEEGEHGGVGAVDVPPGKYVVDVYTYLHSMNGRVVAGDVWHEKLGQWFRRDHPGRPFPSWVAGELCMFSDEDPGHEEEWGDIAGAVESGAVQIDTSALDWVGFLFHLQPFAASAALTPPEEEAWFGADQGLRKPARFPLGIPAVDAEDPEYRSSLRPLLGGDDDEEESPRDRFAEAKPLDVLAKTDARPLAPISGGPVPLPPKQWPWLFRLAWFATSSTAAYPELRLTGPGLEAAAEAFGSWAGAFPRLDGNTLRVGFAGQVGGRWGTGFDEYSTEPWAHVPAGTVFEVATVAPEEEAEPPAGLMRFRGTITGTGDAAVWSLAEAYPAVSATTLREALALAEESYRGDVLTLRSPEEARQILDAFVKEWEVLLHDNRPRVEGSRIRFEEREVSWTFLAATAAFALRYADVWPHSVDEDDDDLDDDE